MSAASPPRQPTRDSPTGIEPIAATGRFTCGSPVSPAIAVGSGLSGRCKVDRRIVRTRSRDWPAWLVGADAGKEASSPVVWPPVASTLEQLAREWTGEIVLLVKRGRLSGDAARFGLRWFIPVIKRFSKVLAEVLVISVFIQLVALVSPLFFRVVIDKILVHRGLTTLEVRVIGVLVVNLADATGLRLRVGRHAAYQQPCNGGEQAHRHDRHGRQRQIPALILCREHERSRALVFWDAERASGAS
jgi:hypothetical protein